MIEGFRIKERKKMNFFERGPTPKDTGLTKKEKQEVKEGMGILKDEKGKIKSEVKEIRRGSPSLTKKEAEKIVVGNSEMKKNTEDFLKSIKEELPGERNIILGKETKENGEKLTREMVAKAGIINDFYRRHGGEDTKGLKLSTDEGRNFKIGFSDIPPVYGEAHNRGRLRIIETDENGDELLKVRINFSAKGDLLPPEDISFLEFNTHYKEEFSSFHYNKPNISWPKGEGYKGHKLEGIEFDLTKEKNKITFATGLEEIRHLSKSIEDYAESYHQNKGLEIEGNIKNPY